MAKRARRRRTASRSKAAPPPKPSFLDLHGRTVAYVVVLAVIIGLVVYGASILDDGDGNGPPPIKDAPDFIVVSVDGDPIDLKMYQGRVVVLDLFTTWCGTCRMQIEELKKLKEAYPPESVVILSVDVDPLENEQMIRDFRDEQNADWPFALDTDDLNGKYEVNEKIPTLVVIDRDGKLAWRHVGVTTVDNLKSVVDAQMGVGS